MSTDTTARNRGDTRAPAPDDPAKPDSPDDLEKRSWRYILRRGRQLQAGIAAEKDIQLPPRDTRKSDKAAEKEQKDIAEGRRIRQNHDGEG